MHNCYSHFGKPRVFTKANHMFYNPWPSNFTSGHKSQCNEGIYIHKKTCTKLSITTLFIIAKTETNPNTHHRKTCQKIVAYSYNAILLNNNNRRTYNWYQNSMKDSQICNFKQKKPDSKRSHTVWPHSYELHQQSKLTINDRNQ